MSVRYPCSVSLQLACAIVLVFASGGMQFYIRCDVHSCVGSDFFNLLHVKVLLAFGAFINVMWAMRRGRMDACRFWHTHRIMQVPMIVIAFLANTMLYLIRLAPSNREP